MQVLKKIFDFYIDSSLHIGLVVFCFLEITKITNSLYSTPNFSFCVFFGTVLGYNFLKYVEVFKNGKYHSKKYYAILVISVLAGIIFWINFYKLEATIQVLFLIAGLLVFSYPFFRNYGWLKLFLVSFAITYITVYIPFKVEKMVVLWNDFDLIQRFLTVSSLMIPFEIFDSKTDAITMNTIPQKIGIAKSKWLGNSMLILFLVIDFLKPHYSNFYLIIDCIIAIVITVFIGFTSIKRDKYYTSFWVESIPIFWWILLILF